MSNLTNLLIFQHDCRLIAARLPKRERDLLANLLTSLTTEIESKDREIEYLKSIISTNKPETTPENHKSYDLEID